MEIQAMQPKNILNSLENVLGEIYGLILINLTFKNVKTTF